MTHKPRKELMNILSYYGWIDYFDDIVAGDDGFPRKPDPASYIYLHNKHKIDLAIGDREIDIIPAKIIGIKTCLFKNSTPGADLYITSYEEFFKNFRDSQFVERVPSDNRVLTLRRMRSSVTSDAPGRAENLCDNLLSACSLMQKR